MKQNVVPVYNCAFDNGLGEDYDCRVPMTMFLGHNYFMFMSLTLLASVFCFVLMSKITRNNEEIGWKMKMQRA